MSRDLEVRAWRHPGSNRLHLNERCRAMHFLRGQMIEVLILASSYEYLQELHDTMPEEWCEWCWTTTQPQLAADAWTPDLN